MHRFAFASLLFACATPESAWPAAYRDVHTKKDLPELSTVVLPAGDVEVRFWIVPSFANARGVVLRTNGSETRALVVDGRGTRAASVSRATWEKVTNEGVLTLPDDSSLPSDGKYILDGVSYVVEVQRDGVVRSYSYGNPAEHEWPEATHVLAIAHVLARALHVRIDDRSAKVRARVPDTDVDASSRAIGASCDPLDMSQSFCGPGGHVAMARERDGRSPCEAKPLPPPNPYEWGACLEGDRVYLSAKGALLVGDIAEMSDDQRLHMQKRMGIAHAAPLRTASEWRAALTASSPAR